MADPAGRFIISLPKNGILAAKRHIARDMKGWDALKRLAAVFICLLLAACQRSPKEVADKVLGDFGLRERPEGYVAGTEKVMAELDRVGATEIKRLNAEQGKSTVKFQEDGLRGMYYKEVKVYESYYPLDASAARRESSGERGYHGYVEFTYRVYQSERRATRTEAMAEAATIPTDDTGREVYRYVFDGGGVWNGGRGQKTRN